jgi:hypothetical protein
MISQFDVVPLHVFTFRVFSPGAGNLCSGKLVYYVPGARLAWPTAANIPKVIATPENAVERRDEQVASFSIYY